MDNDKKKTFTEIWMIAIKKTYTEEGIPKEEKNREELDQRFREQTSATLDEMNKLIPDPADTVEHVNKLWNEMREWFKELPYKDSDEK